MKDMPVKVIKTAVKRPHDSSEFTDLCLKSSVKAQNVVIINEEEDLDSSFGESYKSPSKIVKINSYIDVRENEESSSDQFEEEYNEIQYKSAYATQALFRGEVSKYRLIDCRYPYEYAAGHIDGAVNLYTPLMAIQNLFMTAEDVIEERLEDAVDKVLKNTNRPSRQTDTIFIFYCEFSSVRAPAIASCVRNLDRLVNLRCYPRLCVPHVWLLEGGYRTFHSAYQDLCSPGGYMPMLAESGEGGEVGEESRGDGGGGPRADSERDRLEEYGSYNKEVQRQHKLWSKIYGTKFSLTLKV